MCAQGHLRQKSQRRSVDKNDNTKEQFRKERQALIDKFGGLEESLCANTEQEIKLQQALS